MFDKEVFNTRTLNIPFIDRCIHRQMEITFVLHKSVRDHFSSGNRLKYADEGSHIFSVKMYFADTLNH